jgi:hypothetical protein
MNMDPRQRILKLRKHVQGRDVADSCPLSDPDPFPGLQAARLQVVALLLELNQRS